MIDKITKRIQDFYQSIVNPKDPIELKYVEDKSYELGIYPYPQGSDKYPFSKTSRDTCFLYANGFSHLLINKKDVSPEDLLEIERVIPKGYNTLYVLNREYLCDETGIARQWGTARVSDNAKASAWNDELGKYVVFSKQPIEVKLNGANFISHIVYQNKGTNTSYTDITWTSLEEALQFAKSEGIRNTDSLYIIAKIVDIYNWHQY